MDTARLPENAPIPTHTNSFVIFVVLCLLIFALMAAQVEEDVAQSAVPHALLAIGVRRKKPRLLSGAISLDFIAMRLVSSLVSSLAAMSALPPKADVAEWHRHNR